MTTATRKPRLRCRARRKALGLSQEKAAARCGWNQARWSKYETGRQANPALETVRAVMRALELTSDELDVATT